jgi:hypothetical protein
MRDKGLVFDELRRQRRTWTRASRHATRSWLLGLVVLLLLACVLQAQKIAGRKGTTGHSAIEAIRHDWSQGGQRGGGWYGAKTK